MNAGFLQLGHPGRPADPILVLAQVHQGRQAGLQRHQLGYALGVQQAEVQRNVRAEAVAHQDRFFDAQGIQQAAQILHHVGGGVMVGRDVTIAVSAQVVGGDAVLAA